MSERVNLSDDEFRERLAGPVRVLQIIVLALAMGVSAFLGWVLFQGPPEKPAQPDETALPMTYISLAFAAAAVIARLVVPALFVRNARRQILAGQGMKFGQAPDGTPGPLASLGDAGLLYAVYQIRTIICAAILEGAGFFVCFTYQQERQPIALAAALALIAAILAHFPTPARVAGWIEKQLQRLDDERQSGYLQGGG